jgi:transposase-like protein
MKERSAMNLVQAGKLSETEAREYLESIRWPDGNPTCPHCNGKDVTRLAGEAARPGTIQCNSCRQQFTVTVNTIMEDSHIPLSKWVLAFHLICSSKKGISALQLQRNLGLGSYRTAWFMAHRIREAMNQDGPRAPFTGVTEVDETYVGGKPRKGTGPNKRGRGTKKTPVMVLVERDGNARAFPIDNVEAKTLKNEIAVNVAKAAVVMTDELASYNGIRDDATMHRTVKHGAGEYVRVDADGLKVHTNTAESFFCLLKRGHYGVFHQISKKHLHRYTNEFSFRWDHRKVSDGERTEAAIKKAEGKRLMYGSKAS